MSEHPISEILKISMDSIREMIDANTIIGEAIKSGDITIIPIYNKVLFFLLKL